MYDQRLGDEIMDPQSGAARYLSLRSAEEREREREETRNSAIADLSRDAYVQYAMTWLTLVTQVSSRICVITPNLVVLYQR